MANVFVGPIVVRIESDLDSTLWLRPFIHYLSDPRDGKVESEWRLVVQDLSLNSASQPVDAFYFARHQLQFTADLKNRCATLYTHGEEADFLAALELCLTIACQELGGLSIHGAAAVVDGKGWLMPGPSGTGKSTAARYGGFEKVIADERVFLLPSDGGEWKMVSTPFWSRGRIESPPPVWHRADILLGLEKANSVQLSGVSKIDALESLMRNIVYYGKEPRERELLLEFAIDLLAKTEQYRLEFPKDRPWAWTLSQMHSIYFRTVCERSTSPSTSIGI